MAKNLKENKNKMNPILWFFVAIVIPVAVALTITIIILIIAGVDISGWVKSKNIPVVSSLVSSDTKELNERGSNDNKRIQEKEAEIENLKNNIADLEETNDELELKIVKLENEENSQKNAGLNENETKNTSTEPEDTRESVKKMSNTFRKMDPKQAALIIQDLNKDMALEVFETLSNDARGNILQEMDPKTASELAEKFMKTDDE